MPCNLSSVESRNKSLLLDGKGKEVKENKSIVVAIFFFYLDTAGQHLIEDVSPFLHDPDIL